jgi:hypothetical protein
MTNTEAKV